MSKPNLTPPELTQKDIERFWSHVNISPNLDDCWEWQRKRMEDGYGHFTLRIAKGRTRHLVAPRVAFFLSRQFWPPLFVLHHCDNPPCCNPSHLFMGDTKINMEDAKAKGRLPRGVNHHTKKHPEKILKGSQRYWQAKLTEKSVLEIRRRVSDGERQAVMVREYGVSRSLISLVVLNKVWTHI